MFIILRNQLWITWGGVEVTIKLSNLLRKWALECENKALVWSWIFVANCFVIIWFYRSCKLIEAQSHGIQMCKDVWLLGEQSQNIYGLTQDCKMVSCFPVRQGY